MRGPQAALSILFVLLWLGGCASGGGGGNSPAENRVYCGDNELSARPCSSTIGQAPPPAPTLTSTRTERTPLPPSPATTAGTYEAIALRRLEWKGGDTVRSFVQDSDAVRIRVDPDTRTYTVFIDLPDLTDTSAFTLEDANFGNHVKETYTYSDGSTQTSEFDVNYVTEFQTDKRRSKPDERGTDRLGVITPVIGLQHVSVGQWLQRDVWWDPEKKEYDVAQFECYDCYPLLDSDDGDLGRLIFVYGNRTLPANMPTSGTATFRAHYDALEYGRVDLGLNPSFSFILGVSAAQLTADFGRQSISAKFDHSARKTETPGAPQSPRYEWGIELHGEAPFAMDGRFAIGLSGNLLSIDPAISEQRVALTGRIEGAFFGPAAEEIGGVYLIESTNRSLLMEGAFAAERE